MNRDFRDLLAALLRADARFLVVGAHALAVHGIPRATGADTVVQIGLPPRRVDLLTSISGVSFDAAWSGRFAHTVQGLAVPFLGREQLIANKRATGRTKDLADVEALERGEHRPGA